MKVQFREKGFNTPTEQN